MHYDPVKDRLEAAIRPRPWLRRLLFLVLRHVFLREMEVRTCLDRLARSGFRPRRILDAGTGLGQYTLHLRELFPAAEIVSVDLKGAYLDGMRSFCAAEGIDGIRFERADLVEADWSETFDLILNVDVLEHIVDDQSVLLNFGRALRDEGVLVLHVPAVAEDVRDDALELEEFPVGEHVRLGYKHSGLARRLAGLDFEGLQLRATYGRLGELARWLLVRVPMGLLSASILLAPLVGLWMAVLFLPARLLNALDQRLGRGAGGSLLCLARRRARASVQRRAA